MSGLIKWFSSNDVNAPQLSNTWGCLIDVLDACLVTGFNNQTVASLVITNKVAIATFSGAHGFKQFQVVELLNSDHAEIHNKEFKILGVTSSTIEFYIDLPDRAVTGITSCKLAPLGWKKPFAGIHKAVYQPKDNILNPYYFRIDNSRDPVYTDTYAKFAKVGIFDSCSDIDDLSGNQMPYDPTNPTKNWIGTGSGVAAYSGWFKWRYAVFENLATSSSWGDYNIPINGNREWVLIGNDEGFYILPKMVMNSTFEVPYALGVIQHNGQSKPFLIAANSYNAANGSTSYATPLSSTSNQHLALMQNYEGEVINTQFSRLMTGFSVASSGIAANVIKSDPTDGFILTPYLILDPDQYIMGELPLVKCCINSADTVVNKSIYSDEGGAYLTTRYRVNSGGVIGTLFFKIY